MAWGTDFENDMNRRMDEMSKKMDQKFAKFGIDRKKIKPKTMMSTKNTSITYKGDRVKTDWENLAPGIKTDGATVYVDGKSVKIDNGMDVVVQGSVIELSVQNADKVTVEGTVKNLKNQNADIECKTVHGEVHNQNGDIKIQSLLGDGKITAHNGDVKIKHKSEAVAQPIEVKKVGFVPDYYKALVKAHLKNGGVISVFKEDEGVGVISTDQELDWDKFFYMVSDMGASVTNKPRNHNNKCYIKD